MTIPASRVQLHERPDGEWCVTLDGLWVMAFSGFDAHSRAVAQGKELIGVLEVEPHMLEVPWTGVGPESHGQSLHSTDDP